VSAIEIGIEWVVNTSGAPARAGSGSSPMARTVAERVGKRDYRLVYQSRSGPPGQPWLEPDVCDHLDTLAGIGVTGAVLVPIGFVSDHMEVLFDLDVQARERADRLGLALTRATTPGTDPRFVRMIRELVREQHAGAGPARCAATCCPNPRGPRPTIGAVQVGAGAGSAED